jgi:hypothetical protein
LTAIAAAVLLTTSYAASQNVQTPGPAKNEILWKAAYGPDSEMPAPVRAGIIRFLPSGEGDD